LKTRDLTNDDFPPRELRKASPPFEGGARGGASRWPPSCNRRATKSAKSFTAKFINKAHFSTAQDDPANLEWRRRDMGSIALVQSLLHPEQQEQAVRHHFPAAVLDEPIPVILGDPLECPLGLDIVAHDDE
jgi:hypothetical protein